ncbi:MAG: response regulator [Mariniphaga sp.]
MEVDKRGNQVIKKVLVAEDDEFNYLLIETVLTLHGYSVVHARNGKEAIGLFRSEKTIDIVLMDLQMPVMDGFAAIQEIRTFDEHVPVIVQTTHNIDGMRDKAFRVGCSDFITKPIEPEVLLNKIEKYL